MTLARLVPLLLVATAACVHDATGPAFSQDGFSVRVASGELIIRNDSRAVIHYVALEEETSVVVDLLPTPEDWPALQAGAEKRIPFEQLDGYHSAAHQARIYWWANNRYQPHIVVDFR